MDSSTDEQWGKVPLWWVRVLRLKRNALAVAAALSYHARESGTAGYPSPETLSQETGIRRDRVFVAIKELKAAGIIVKSERRHNAPTRHWLRYEVQESGTPESGTAPEVKDRKAVEGSTGKRSSEVQLLRSTNRSSNRSSKRSVSIDGLKKINFSIDEGTEGERGFAIIGLLQELEGLDLAKARLETQSLTRQANGDLDLVYQWLKFAAHKPGVESVIKYAMSCIAKGEFPPKPADRYPGIPRDYQDSVLTGAA